MKATIIGAGIGGLCAALALRKIGYEVQVFERVPAIRDVGAGISLWPNAIYALDQLGVGDQLRANGIGEKAGGIYTPNGTTLSTTDVHALERQFHNPTVIIHRAVLSRVLTDALDSPISAIHLNKTFASYEEHGQTISASFSDGTSTESDLLICADGLRSTLRQHWFPDHRIHYCGDVSWRGVTRFDHQRVGTRWGQGLGRGLRFGIIPLADEGVYWFATQNLPESTPINDSQQYLKRLFAGWYSPIPALIENTPANQILQNPVYDFDPLPYWVRGRAVLLGDSAHTMTPSMGQGGCQAIEDAVVLAKCLGKTADIGAGLQDYQAQRLEHANRVLLMSRQSAKLLSSKNPVLCFVRNSAFRLLPPQRLLRNLAPIIGHQV